MASRTFYKRPLLPPGVALASPAGRAMFASALATGGAEVFFDTVSHFNTQDEPAFCGLASLAMALNALAVDPRRVWKGPWRYYSETLLDCCLPLETVKKEGITLDQAACLARCNGADVMVRRPPPVDGDATAVAASFDSFKEDVAASAAGSGGIVIVSYSRAAVNQTGDGHFAVIGAYDCAAGGDDGSVLILDTARFKLPPHFLPLKSTFEAMRPPDSATGKPRGWMVLQAAPATSVLFSLARGSDSETAPARDWAASGSGAAAALASAPTSDAAAALAAVAASAPAAAIAALVAARSAALGRSSPPPPPPGACGTSATPCAPTDAAATLLRELRATPLFAAVQAGLTAAHPDATSCAAHATASADGSGLLPERVALFLAALQAEAWAGRADVASLVAAHPGSVLEGEVAYVSRQLAELPAMTAADAVAAAGGGCRCGKVA